MLYGLSTIVFATPILTILAIVVGFFTGSLLGAILGLIVGFGTSVTDRDCNWRKVGAALGAVVSLATGVWIRGGIITQLGLLADVLLLAYQVLIGTIGGWQAGKYFGRLRAGFA